MSRLVTSAMRASALGGGAGRISIGRPIGIGGIHWDSHCWRPMSVVSEASAMKLRWFCTCAPPACSSRRKRSSEDCKRRRKPAIFAGACDRASWATLNNSGAVHHRSRVTCGPLPVEYGQQRRHISTRTLRRPLSATRRRKTCLHLRQRADVVIANAHIPSAL